MSDLHGLWERQPDDDITEAARHLDEYTREAQQVILMELRRRGLATPQTSSHPNSTQATVPDISRSQTLHDPSQRDTCPAPYQTLTKERNIFLAGFFAVVAVGVVLRLLQLSASPGAQSDVLAPATVLSIVAKVVFVYLVFRLSRFLHQPVWLTVLYCALIPFSLLYLIPFIGLLVAVRNARRALGSSEPRGVPPGTHGRSRR